MIPHLHVWPGRSSEMPKHVLSCYNENYDSTNVNIDDNKQNEIESDDHYGRTNVDIDENHNEVIRTVGEKPNFDFSVLDHSDLGKKKKIIDFDLVIKATFAPES